MPSPQGRSAGGRGRPPVIVVAGESLVDLIVGADGAITASPGGGPFNVARTVARLGLRSLFLGPLSEDPFGGLLAGALAHDGVEAILGERVSLPTALAVVSVLGGGVPRYWFHLAGTAAFALDDPEVLRPLLPGMGAVHVGTLGLVVEPMASCLEGIVARLPAPVLLMVDPNCRPAAILDEAAYRSRLRRLLSRADVVKVSCDDLGYLLPGVDPASAARRLLELGPRAVLLTDGPRPVHAFSRTAEVEAPVPAVAVVDTIGAGDVFGGAFLAWWVEHGLLGPDLERPEALRAAISTAASAASWTCGRPGAEPPRREVLAGRGWESRRAAP